MSASLPLPAELIEVSEVLVARTAAASPSAGQRRRAVSTAYYAVFHTLLQAAADRFIGPPRSADASYKIIYRGFNHGRMRAVCEALAARQLSQALRLQLARTTASQAVRDFAALFVYLQNARNGADYDPAWDEQWSECIDLVDRAKAALALFSTITPNDKTDMLALMLIAPRG